MFARLARVMGQPELAAPDVFGPKAFRLEARDQVNHLVAEWVGSLPCAEVLERCQAGEVPVGPLYSIAQIFEDPQYSHRESIVVEESRVGPLAVPGTIPSMSATPGEIRWLGRELGSDTDDVLRDLLGLTDARIAKLRSEGVI
jgi:crotonobetainyl-CoA:carnitine CoA-transferase CaiB-like acyl-CoA transferase